MNFIRHFTLRNLFVAGALTATIVGVALLLVDSQSPAASRFVSAFGAHIFGLKVALTAIAVVALCAIWWVPRWQLGKRERRLQGQTRS